MERKSKPRRKGRNPFRRPVPFYKKKYSIEDIAVSAYQGVKQIKKLINTEVKQLDTVVSNSPDNSTVDATFVTSLVSVAQGDSFNERSGISIRPQRLRILGHFTKHTTPVETALRVLIVKDKQQVAGTPPSTSNILNTGSGFLVNAAPNSTNQQYGNTRFKILSDQRLIASTSYPTVLYNVDLNLSGHVTYYTTTGASVQSSGLYLVAMSDQATNVPTFAWTAEFTYTDD